LDSDGNPPISIFTGGNRPAAPSSAPPAAPDPAAPRGPFDQALIAALAAAQTLPDFRRLVPGVAVITRSAEDADEVRLRQIFNGIVEDAAAMDAALAEDPDLKG
jgi:hypothetical protein